MILYKLTDQEGNTQNNTHWSVGKTHKKKACKKQDLCSKGVFHAYTNLNLAFLLNSCHANIDNPIVWECNGKPCVSDWGKVGCFSLSITKQLDVPGWVNSNKANLVQVAFAILCAEAVLGIYEKKYPQNNVPRKAIEAAKAYLSNPSAHAADAAYAAYAADAAAHAAYAADANINFDKLADMAVEMIFPKERE